MMGVCWGGFNVVGDVLVEEGERLGMGRVLDVDMGFVFGVEVKVFRKMGMLRGKKMVLGGDNEVGVVVGGELWGGVGVGRVEEGGWDGIVECGVVDVGSVVGVVDVVFGVDVNEGEV